MEVPGTTGELGIGDLARLTGVSVRTIRFYCDEGILAARRSGGGHRRFGEDAVERLGLVRRLRGLGLGLPAITAVLTGERSVAEAVAVERAALDVELAALSWRRASLRAVEEAGPADRAARLDLLAAVQDSRAAHEALVSFWHRLTLSPLPVEVFSTFVEMCVPDPPVDPTPAKVVAYAELVTLVGNRSLTRQLMARARVNQKLISDEGALLTGVGEACALAEPLVLAGHPPAPGPALDCFVEIHAAVRGERDSPTFRRELLTDTAVDRDPRLNRYWQLVREVTGEPATAGTIHSWLLDALQHSVDSP
ncbi:MerR family transcriptional regulator [Amycolatopsis nigrescens]|uniref:MerR family transcriptional regulator n=1 Tax=Amycolatopsis nigrescens TaxID=381445 RepID=UPI00036719CC|nr:MerR family transcriptional regulator [Amycolatopsis nigrescens]